MQKLLDDALEKLPVSEYNNNILFRSGKFSENEIKRLFKAGKKFVDKGFFSTTYSEEALFAWMRSAPTDNVLFKVYGKNGKLIDVAAHLPHEAEVLFKSGTEFAVESILKVDHPLVSRARVGEKVFEIILKEI